MIRYDLVCSAEHAFDSWFRDSAAYDKAAAAGLVACPVCGSTEVEKALMAPAVAGTDRPAREAPPEPRLPVAAADPRREAVIAMLREMKKHVLANADPVGDKFAEEALKSHFGEAEPRSIYGEATAEEARRLIEEGVEFAPLPVLPEEGN